MDCLMNQYHTYSTISTHTQREHANSVQENNGQSQQGSDKSCPRCNATNKNQTEILLFWGKVNSSLKNFKTFHIYLNPSSVHPMLTSCYLQNSLKPCDPKPPSCSFTFSSELTEKLIKNEPQPVPAAKDQLSVTIIQHQVSKSTHVTGEAPNLRISYGIKSTTGKSYSWSIK